MNEENSSPDWTHLLLVLQDESGSLSPSSKEMLGKGRELADQLGAWLMVYSIYPSSDQGKEIISHGADRVFQDEPKALPAQINSLAKIIEEQRPEIVIFPSSRGMLPLAAPIAQRFKTGLATDCVALTLDLAERRLIATHPLYDGKLWEEVCWPTRRPQIVMVQAGAFSEAFPDPYREGTVEKI